MFGFRRSGLLGIGGYYAWKNRARLSRLLGRFGGSSRIGNEYERSTNVSEQDKSNVNIGRTDQKNRSGAV